MKTKSNTNVVYSFEFYKKLNFKMTMIFVIGIFNLVLYALIEYQLKTPNMLIDDSKFQALKAFLDYAIYVVILMLAVSIIGRIYAQFEIKKIHNKTTLDHTAQIQIKKIQKLFIL